MMDAQRMDMATNLMRHGIRPSTQRMRIFEFLAASKAHPTADDVFQALVPEMPSLSKTTVYNTLSLLVRENLARQLSIEDGEARYDGDISMHGHFRCVRCGAVSDFTVDMESLVTQGLDDCIVQTKDVFFRAFAAIVLSGPNRSHQPSPFYTGGCLHIFEKELFDT